MMEFWLYKYVCFNDIFWLIQNMPHLKLWPHMQNIRKGFLHTHASQGLEIKPSLPPSIPNFSLSHHTLSSI